MIRATTSVLESQDEAEAGAKHHQGDPAQAAQAVERLWRKHQKATL